MILKPAFPQPWLESHPCTGLPAKAGSDPAGLPAPCQREASSTITTLEQGCRGLRHTGKVPGQSLCAYDQRERSKDGCGSCYVNSAVPRCWRPSCLPGWKMTQGSLKQSHPAPGQPGNPPNPILLLFLPGPWPHIALTFSFGF